MPLSKDDPALDYDGSWGDASRGWPTIQFQTEEQAEKAYVIAHSIVKIPYGSYVLVRNGLRLETSDYVKRVQFALAGHGYYPDAPKPKPIEKNCHACAFSYMEPDSPLICGHKDSGMFGLSLAGMNAPSKEGGHCGPTRTKFVQHPRRNPDGSLR